MFSRHLFRRKRDIIEPGKRYDNVDYVRKLLDDFAAKRFDDDDDEQRDHARAALADTLFLMEVLGELRTLVDVAAPTSLDAEWFGEVERSDAFFMDFGDYISYTGDSNAIDYYEDAEESEGAGGNEQPRQQALGSRMFDERLVAMVREYAVAGGARMLDNELWMRAAARDPAIEPRHRRHVVQSIHKQVARVRKITTYVGAYGYLRYLMPETSEQYVLLRMLRSMPRLYASVAVAVDALGVAVDAALFRVWLLYRGLAGHETEPFEAVLDCVDDQARDDIDLLGMRAYLEPRLGRVEALRFLQRQLKTYVDGDYDARSLDDDTSDEYEYSDDASDHDEMADFIESDDAGDGGTLSAEELRRQLDAAISLHGKKRQGGPATIEEVEREFAEQRARDGGDRDAKRRALFSSPAQAALRSLLARAHPNALGGVRLRYR